MEVVLTLPLGQPHISHAYTGDNRLTQVDKNGTITTYEYDLNGNLVGDSNGSFYGYDEENRLVYAKVDGVVSEYGISTEGLRVSKGVGNDYTYEESTSYTIDQDGNVILENGDDIIRGHQALAKRTEDGSYYYYIYNGHGDVVMLVDESGNVKNSYAYDAWGKITSETETIPNSIKYAGEYYDAETGFLYLRNRMYDPATRRFTSEDPARDQLNWYVYCGNNPVMFVDPWGLYNRDAAVSYARKWYNSTNSPTYERFDTVSNFIDSMGRLRGDCANFVSQCLIAGGLTMNSSWHYYQYKREWLSGSGNHSGTYIDRDMTSAWATAPGQYEFFSNPYSGYIEGEVLQIWTIEGLRYNVKYNNIQKGDLMFFAYRDTGEVYHATIITKVDNTDIYYSAHTDPRLDEPLSNHLDKNMVYIIRIRDEAVRGYTT